MVKKIPKHVALIPDGNRRWAKEKGFAITAGHVKAGAYGNLYPLFEEAWNLGIKYISLWGFGGDNWKRDKKEVDKIFSVISKGLDRMGDEAEKEKYCVKHIGRKDRLPKEMVEKLEKLERMTKGNNGLKILLCIDYSGRDEIVRAVSKVLESGKEVGEVDFADCLDTKGIPDVDLMVRTGGEKRMSGFMPFQSIYAELYFTDIYFPDFGPGDLREAVEDFSKRKRRFGGD